MTQTKGLKDTLKNRLGTCFLHGIKEVVDNISKNTIANEKLKYSNSI